VLKTAQSPLLGCVGRLSMSLSSSVRGTSVEQHPVTLILYACSISQAYPVTLEAYYRPPTEDLGREYCGMSRFYDGVASRPLEAQYDAHSVPVRDCGCCHPWDGVTPMYRDLDYQAATEEHPNPAMRPTAHELVLSNSLRCTPIALKSQRDAAVPPSSCGKVESVEKSE
jgi:hypothetical protein